MYYPQRKTSNFKVLKRAVEERGFGVRVKFPIIFINQIIYEYPHGLEKMREIVKKYQPIEGMGEKQFNVWRRG